MIPRIFPEALDVSLSKGLLPFYLLVGQDMLLVGESKDNIVLTARQHGFEEKNEYVINNETKWETLFEQAQSYGLFASRQILIANCPDNITATQQKHLAELLSFSNPDLLFILHIPKLTKAMEKQAWFTQLAHNAIQINCQTPDATKLPMWVQHRAKAMGLQLDQDTIKLLCYSYEGNLFALKQALQLLQLQFFEQKISLEKAKKVIEQSAQFTPFQWVDALLDGKIERATRILHHLQNEETQPVVLLRIIQKELMLLLEITRAPQPIHSQQRLYSGNLRTEFDRLKVWQNRRMLYQNAVNRLTYAKLYTLIQRLALLEKQLKQEFSPTIWIELERFGLLFH